MGPILVTPGAPRLALRFAYPTALTALAIVVTALLAALVPARAGEAGRPPAPSDIALVDAVTWGIDRASADAIATQGRDAWLRAQLRPGADDRLPAEVRQQIDALPSRRTPFVDLVREFDARNRAAGQIADPDQKAAARKALREEMADVGRDSATAFVLRALYSPDQLRERLVWFWLDHFNVHQRKANLRLMVGDYVDTAIRPHALGRFRDLLMATLRHPAMLRYLDNADNAVGRINENYAREIMELHTMGVGSGYTQKDVEELAKILTGAGIDPKPEAPRVKPELAPLVVRDGLFLFNTARHDFSDKVL
ncbi:DUF1800 family protein, partial [Rhodoplanes sp. SY1]|uniref:DUF1800 family protein n=1 Tax=Rhodoplanes sp. SY1 TaxID=3166646 RepID=UPI0038B57F07